MTNFHEQIISLVRDYLLLALMNISNIAFDWESQGLRVSFKEITQKKILSIREDHIKC